MTAPFSLTYLVWKYRQTANVFYYRLAILAASNCASIFSCTDYVNLYFYSNQNVADISIDER